MEQEQISLNDRSPDFSSPWHFSDVVLVVEGTKFYVHKSTLSMWSPVFEKMFTSPFAERSANEIPLPGKRQNEIEVLLRLIYSNGTRQQVVNGISAIHFRFIFLFFEALCVNFILCLLISPPSSPPSLPSSHPSF